MALVTLALWIFTAAAGFTTLRAGGAAKRAAAKSVVTGPGEAAPGATDPGASVTVPRQAAFATAPAGSAPPAGPAPLTGWVPLTGSMPLAARIGAIPLREDGRPPLGPHAHVATPSGEHPMLEFSHPTLAISGLACWLMFTFLHYLPLGWISFGFMATTLCIGLTWATLNHRAAERQAREAWKFPPRLMALHGLSAGLSITLTVLMALSIIH